MKEVFIDTFYYGYFGTDVDVRASIEYRDKYDFLIVRRLHDRFDEVWRLRRAKIHFLFKIASMDFLNSIRSFSSGISSERWAINSAA